MARATVEIEDKQFAPDRRQIEPVTTVGWQTTGSSTHVVDTVQHHTAVDRWRFHTQMLRAGENAVHPFGEAETYELSCCLQSEDTCGLILVGDVLHPEALTC